MNKLEEWTLGQFALKVHHLKSLKLATLNTTDDNRSLLLEFAAQTVNSSRCLTSLYIAGTNSSGTDGDKFM